MKKLISFMLVILFAASLFACGGGAGESKAPGETKASEKTGTEESSEEGTLPGLWNGTLNVNYDDDESVLYSYSLMIHENPDPPYLRGTLVQSWTYNSVKIEYTYSVFVYENTMKISGQKETKNGETVDINVEDMVKFTVDYSVKGNKLELGKAYDYDTNNFDMEDDFPVTLEKTPL